MRLLLRGDWLLPAVLVAVAALARLLVAARVQLPSRDGAIYLWMGEQIARGDFAASFATVFPPVYPWTIAIVLRWWPGLDPVTAGQLASAGLGALATLPLWSIAARVAGRGGAVAACAFYALGTWFARHPADCLSEGPFYLLVALVVRGLLRAPGVAAGIGLGVGAGLAFGTRPEGAALAIVGVPWLWQHDRRSAVAMAAAATGCALALGSGYARFGSGFTLTPKLGFHWGADSSLGEATGVLAFLAEAVRVPGHVFEALGYVATALAILGLAVWWPRGTTWRERLRTPHALLLGLFLLQLLAIPAVRATIRFVSGYGMLLLPFAGVGGVWLAARGWPRARWLRVVLVVLAFVPDGARLPVSQRGDKTIERDLGQHLRTRLQPGERVAAFERRSSSGVELPFTMCRLEYFAGQQPFAPRPLLPAAARELAADRRARFLVLADAVTGFEAAAVTALGYGPCALPAPLRERTAARGIDVFERGR